MSDANKPTIYYKSAYAHSGSYSLMLNYLGIYAMPPYEGDVSGLQMTFYLRQPLAKYRVQVGVMSDLADPATFVPVATVNNSTTGVEAVSVDFGGYTGGGRYIAFRNILPSGQSGDYSVNYIDDITLSVASAKGERPHDSYDVPESRDSTLYPNPTTGRLTIESDEEVVRIDVYDYTGRRVAVYESQTEIDLGRLAAGLYTLRVTLPERVEVRRVVKQ